MGITRLRKLFDAVARQLERMEALVELPEPVLETPSPGVSGWSVAQHLEHVAVAGSMTFRRLGKLLDDPQARDEGRLSPLGHLVLLLGWIPRGLGEAPSRSRPGSGNRQCAVEALGELRRSFEALAGRLDEMATRRFRFAHPYLGFLDCRQWLRFTAVHQAHHLRIAAELESAHTAGAA